MTKEEALTLKPGDLVDHIEDGFWSEPCAVERVDGALFADDPVVYFVEGGFWRSSRLKKAAA